MFEFSSMHLLIAIAALTGAWVFFRVVLPRLKAAWDYARKMQISGYLPPSPTDRGLRWLLRLSRFIAFVQVGKIKVYGAQNLEGIPGSYIVTPNHPHFADVAVLPIVVNRKARYMAARGVMTFCGGLGGLIAGPIGAFAADLTPGKGGAARNTAVQVLLNGEPLVLFPEGWAYLDGSMGPFKKGAVRIVKEAASKLGKPTYLVPVHLRYGRYPGAWIKKLDPRLEYLLLFLASPFYRSGVDVVIGKPIPSTDLPADDGEATEKLKQAIIALDLKPGANKLLP